MPVSPVNNVEPLAALRLETPVHPAVPTIFSRNRLLAVFAFKGLGRWIAGPQAQLSGVHWLAALRLETPVHPAVPTILTKVHTKHMGYTLYRRHG